MNFWRRPGAFHTYTRLVFHFNSDLESLVWVQQVLLSVVDYVSQQTLSEVRGAGNW